MAQLRERADFDHARYARAMNALIADGAQIEVLYVHGHWRGVNDLEDLQRAVDFAYGQTPFGSAPEGGSSAANDMIEARDFVEAARAARVRVVRWRSLLLSDAVHQLRTAGSSRCATCRWQMRATRWR